MKVLSSQDSTRVVSRKGGCYGVKYRKQIQLEGFLLVEVLVYTSLLLVFLGALALVPTYEVDRHDLYREVRHLVSFMKRVQLFNVYGAASIEDSPSYRGGSAADVNHRNSNHTINGELDDLVTDVNHRDSNHTINGELDDLVADVNHNDSNHTMDRYLHDSVDSHEMDSLKHTKLYAIVFDEHGYGIPFGSYEWYTLPHYTIRQEGTNVLEFDRLTGEGSVPRFYLSDQKGNSSTIILARHSGRIRWQGGLSK